MLQQELQGNGVANECSCMEKEEAIRSGVQVCVQVTRFLGSQGVHEGSRVASRDRPEQRVGRG
jgi:hypothetical protein